MEKPTDKSLNRKQNFFSEWLEKLQQESWQLELLISGLALFGIWESKSVLYRIEYYVAVNSISEIDDIAGLFTSLLWASWYIFLLNLLIHIIIRGFWIGAIGLRYVSGDIDYQDLNYSERFTTFFKKRTGSFDEYIERLEKISSVLFSFTFLLFFMLLSFVLYIVVWIIIFSIIDYLFPLQSGVTPVIHIAVGVLYWLIGFIVLIDFFTLGAFKKISEKSISGFYFYIYRFYSAVSLSFIYRPLLLNFIDNKYTRRLFFLSIPYSIIFIGLTTLGVNKFIYFPSFEERSLFHSEMVEETINWRYYDDLRNDYHRSFDPQSEDLRKTKIQRISLANYEVRDMFLKFFIEYKDSDNDFIGQEVENEKIYAYRKKGLKYLFNRRRNKDENFDNISQNEYKELQLATKIILKEELPENVDASILEEYKSYKKEDLSKMRKGVIAKYDLIKADYQLKKLQKIKKRQLSQYEFYLDGIPLNKGDLDCKFYIHPNMREKGLLCYLNIDSLEYGGHILDMHKNIQRKSLKRNTVTTKTVKRNIPFRKIK